MTPAQIIALVRDVLILAALVFVVLWIWRSGEDRVKVQDMAAVQKQLTDNAKKLDDWKKEAADADKKRASDMQDVRALIAQHNQPILVRAPAAAPRPLSVPGDPSAAVCATTGSGRPDAGPGSGAGTVDLRPAIAQLELKYESALSDCRAALAKWPH